MDYCPDREIDAESFIKTSTGNIISKLAVISDTRTLEVPSGRCFIDEDVLLRSDIAAIQLNKYTYISKGVQFIPSRTLKVPIKPIKITIGQHCFIDERTSIEAARIGVGCIIGKNCKLLARCILKDFVIILDNTIIPPDMVIPPLSIVGGNPAEIISEQPESATTLIPLAAVERYRAIKLTKLTEQEQEVNIAENS